MVRLVPWRVLRLARIFTEGEGTMIRGTDVWGQALQNALAQLGQAYGQKIQTDRRNEEIGGLLKYFTDAQDQQPIPTMMPSAGGLGVEMQSIPQNVQRPMFDERNQAQLARYAQLDPTGFQVAKSLQPSPWQFINQERGGLQGVRQSPSGQIDFRQLKESSPEKTSVGSQDWQIEYDAKGKPVTEKVGDATVVKEFKYQQNPFTQQVEKIYRHGKSDQPQNPFTAVRPAMNLAKDFQARKEVLYFNEVVPRYFTMKKALQEADGKNPETFVAIDQSLITLFNKITDPGSVVRESEYARTPGDLALIKRIDAFASRIEKGGRLEPSARQALVRMANKFYDVAAQRYGIVRSDFEHNSKVYGIDPSLVVGTDMRKDTEVGTPSNGGVVPPPGAVVKRYNPATGKVE